MTLSIAEKGYLYDSLSSKEALRPDGRLPHQFRPLEISTDFLPSSNGSSRIVTSDGSECIVSVKSKVIEHRDDEPLIEFVLDIAGERDDSVLVQSVTSLFNKVIGNINCDSLRLTQRYSFKIYIDVLVLSSFAYPITLISFGIYSSLKTTLLPKLISTFDDLEIEELPTFHGYDMVPLEVNPPLVFLLAVVGENIFVDPQSTENDVCNNGIIISWYNGKIIAPIRTISLNNTNAKGFAPHILQKSVELVNKCAPEIIKTLDSD